MSPYLASILLAITHAIHFMNVIFTLPYLASIHL